MRELLSEKTIFYSSTARNSSDPIYNHEVIIPFDVLAVNPNEVGSLELVQFSTKMSWYCIDDLRNASFTYSENSNVTSTTCSFPNGSYSITQLSTVIETALNGVATALSWNVSVDLLTMKLTFVRTGTPAGNVVWTPIGTLTTFNLFGFDNVAKTMSASETSTKIATIGNTEAIFVHADVFNRALNSYAEANKNNILCSIPVLCPFFGIIYWESSGWAPVIDLPASETVTKMHFSIMDKFNNYVRLTDEYSMTFKFKKYRKDPINLSRLESLLTISSLNTMKN